MRLQLGNEVELVETILLMALVVSALSLIVLIMIQQGKGADVGAAFGSGSSNTLFGSAGSASFLTRVTTWLAIAFFGITFGLAYIAKEKATSMDQLGLPSAALIDQQRVPVEEESGPQIPDISEAPVPVESGVPVDDAGGSDAPSLDVPARDEQ